MQADTIQPTFTHQEPFQYSLTCTLNNNQAQNHSLQLSLHVPTDTFPKAYSKIIGDIDFPPQLALVFQNVTNLYRIMKNKQNIEVLYNWGIIKIKYSLQFSQQKIQKWAQIRMDRSMQGQLDYIRSILDEKMEELNSISELDNRIDKLWKRKQENEKIFLKFREDTQFRVDEIGERMSIQNTKMGILREDVNKLLIAFDKLSSIVCPIFTKINVNSSFTNQFILHDRKIMYIGESGYWTQILFKNQIPHKKFEVSFKIVNTKRSNIVAGITLVCQQNLRSSIQSTKADRKYIGLSGMGQLHSSELLGIQGKNGLTYAYSESDKQVQQKQKQQKSNHQITLSSPPTNSMKSSIISKQSYSNQSFKSMQIIKMCIELDKQKISWRNGNKLILETKIGGDLKNQPIVPYFQFCDTGDSIQCIDL